MTKEETIDLLNELIHVCKDGEHGYRTAAEDVRNSQLQSVFGEYAKQRGSCARQLQAEVERLGGVGADSGTFTAAVHRGWIDLKAALSGGDGGAIIAACETGEDYTLAAFERVVNAGITGESLSIVEKQCGKNRWKLCHADQLRASRGDLLCHGSYLFHDRREPQYRVAQGLRSAR
jgi:uncharacterized protein (TIGR02284 family)